MGMNTREWLYRAYNIDKEIKEIEEAYNSAVADVFYTSPQFDIDSVQKSPSNAAEQKVERLVMRKEKYLQRLQILKDNKYKLLFEITKAIEQIPRCLFVLYCCNPCAVSLYFYFDYKSYKG